MSNTNLWDKRLKRLAQEKRPHLVLVSPLPDLAFFLAKNDNRDTALSQFKQYADDVNAVMAKGESGV